MTLLRVTGKPRFAYLLALSLPIVGFLATRFAAGLVADQLDLAIAYLVVFVVALYGGFLPGLIATAWTAILETMVAPSPVGASAFAAPDPTRLVIFLVAGTLASLAAGLVQDARLRAERARLQEGAARIEADRAAARSVALAELSAESRARAEASRQRLDLLADAGRILGASLDYSSTLPALARLTVPVLGDLCIVDLDGEEQARVVVADELIDEGLAQQLGAAGAPRSWSADVARALDDNRSIVVTLDAAEAGAGAADGAGGDGAGGDGAGGAGGSADRAGVRADGDTRVSPWNASSATTVSVAALLRLGLRRAVVVPIRVRETLLGTFVFATTDATREYEATDLSTSEVLAQRAAKAIDNGRMHQEIQRLAAHAQERAAELESVVSAIGEGILVCGPDGSVHVANAAAERMLGGRVADQDELRGKLTAHGDALPDPGVSFGPVEFQLADRPTGWLELTAYPVAVASRPPDGDAGRDAGTPPDHAASGAPRPEEDRSCGPAGVEATDPREPAPVVSPLATVYVLRDVTAFRQGQRLREAFLGLLSHELRTPVTTIYAAANVLARPNSTIEPETQQDILRDMVGESDRLYRLVEDLMVLARFDEGLDLARDPNLLQHIIPAVIDNERSRWPHVRFALDRDPDLPAVNGDETSIQQVLRNLLSNAAKYSPVGSTIVVRVEGELDGVRVRVLDEGTGIRSTEADDLFDPFYRSPETAGMASGAGIGLYVSRRLLDAMGGRIWALPRANVGSEFCFWLPRYVAPPDETGPGTEDGLDAAVEAADSILRRSGGTSARHDGLDTHL